MKIAVAIVATSLVSLAATNALGGASSVPGYGVTETAAISQSPTTVGISDSDLLFMNSVDINKTLDAMQALGVNTVRVQIPWAAVELNPGGYNWTQVDAVVNAAASRNMAILGILSTTPAWAAAPGGTYPSGTPKDPSKFGAFAGLAAARYAGKVSAYEVWNEPNAALFYSPTPNAAGYVALLKAVYPAIKIADPSALVVGGAIASIPTNDGAVATAAVDFVAQMYAAGARGYFDALSYHPYKYGLAFSTGLPLATSPAGQLMAIRQLMINNGDANKLIWATEYGEPVSVSGEAMQAALLSDMLNTWSNIPYAGPLFVYTTRDKLTASEDPEDTFGLYRSDWTARAAATVVKNFIAGIRTPIYGSGPVIAIAAAYQEFKRVHGAAAADDAIGAVYGQAIQDHGEVVARIYFYAIGLVIQAANVVQAVTAALVPAAPQPVARSLSPTQTAAATTSVAKIKDDTPVAVATTAATTTPAKGIATATATAEKTPTVRVIESVVGEPDSATVAVVTPPASEAEPTPAEAETSATTEAAAETEAPAKTEASEDVRESKVTPADSVKQRKPGIHVKRRADADVTPGGVAPKVVPAETGAPTADTPSDGSTGTTTEGSGTGDTAAAA